MREKEGERGGVLQIGGKLKMGGRQRGRGAEEEENISLVMRGRASPTGAEISLGKWKTMYVGQVCAAD